MIKNTSEFLPAWAEESSMEWSDRKPRQVRALYPFYACIYNFENVVLQLIFSRRKFNGALLISTDSWYFENLFTFITRAVR